MGTDVPTHSWLPFAWSMNPLLVLSPELSAGSVPSPQWTLSSHIGIQEPATTCVAFCFIDPAQNSYRKGYVAITALSPIMHLPSPVRTVMPAAPPQQIEAGTLVVGGGRSKLAAWSSHQFPSDDLGCSSLLSPCRRGWWSQKGSDMQE